ncbi:MAG: FkbM family methyltransferase [Proteobacteria bacterium]|nr:FkbM family methyltransferase [Pseudomonadota bacterium]
MLEALLHNASIPLRLRKKVGKLLPVKPHVPFTARLFENVYEGVTGSHLDNKIFLYGMHEPATIRLMRGVLRMQRAAGMAPVYLDIGTNTGAHLLAVASLADRAYGFEPWAPVRARALENVIRNKLSHVTIFDFGVGSTDAALPFAPPVSGNHGTGSFFRQDDANSVTLNIRRGDSVIAENGIAPTLIKIDTEGFERPILEGLRDTLAQHQPVVVFEYSAMSKPDFSDDGMMTRLFGEGYSFYGLKPSREMPCFEPLCFGERYENVIAWPLIQNTGDLHAGMKLQILKN